MRLHRLSLLLALVAACNRGAGAERGGAPIKVAAASDLSFAFTELGKQFTAETGREVIFSFGSTGQLAKQIKEGAPFDVFAAANVSFVDDVVAAGACDEATVAQYATGRVVIFWSKSSKVAPPSSLADLADPRFVKLAIANPEHAPYGKAGKQALEKAGVWEAVQGKVVYGENISQTMQYAQTGNVEAAIVALSLALVSKDGDYLPIDAGLHAPIDQALVVCSHGADAAAGRRFADYVNGKAGRAVMRRYGFMLPGEAAP